MCNCASKFAAEAADLFFSNQESTFSLSHFHFPHPSQFLSLLSFSTFSGRNQRVDESSQILQKLSVDNFHRSSKVTKNFEKKSFRKKHLKMGKNKEEANGIPSSVKETVQVIKSFIFQFQLLVRSVSNKYNKLFHFIKHTSLSSFD